MIDKSNKSQNTFEKTSHDEKTFSDVHDAELREIRGTESPEGRFTSGIALTGGGIRSGVFALGVLQALAKKNLLGSFDYLSSVSGGGYAACSLHWLLHAGAKKDGNGEPGSPRYGLEPDNFPLLEENRFPSGSEETSEDGREYLEYIRNHGDYLKTGNITAFSGVAVVLRAIFLNLLVWLPITFLFFAAVALIGRSLVEFQGPNASFFFAWLQDYLVPIVGENWKEYTNGLTVYLLSLLGALIIVIVAGLRAIIYSFQTRRTRSTGHKLYSARRRWEIRSGKLSVWFLALLMFGSIPLWAALLKYLSGTVIVFGGAGGDLEWLSSLPAIIIGLIALVPVVQKTLAKLDDPTERHILAPVGCALFILGLITLSFQVGFAIGNSIEEILISLGLGSPSSADVSNVSGLLLVGFGIWLVVAFVVGLCVNINSISLHRFYRDRLMEAFMPSADANGPLKEEMVSGLSSADDCRLDALNTSRDGPLKGKLYPLICCHAVLIDSQNPKTKRRGGESFVLSPLFSGSDSLGWIATEKLNGGSMTLPTAMAISGAAINPSTGASGRGPTMGRLVGFTMALLNLRLGYWINRPNKSSGSNSRPNHFRPGLYAFSSVLGLPSRWFGKYDESSAFTAISDGGHFDNSGLYELFRRKVEFILFVDGGQDPGYKFENFINLLRRVQEDFPSVDFEAAREGRSRLDDLVATEDSVFPYGRKVSNSASSVIDFHYTDADGNKTPATLVYLKLTMIKDLPDAVKGYQAAKEKFPHDPTIDQFFDPAQFSAYLEIGRCLANDMIKNVKSDAEGDNPPVGLAALLKLRKELANKKAVS
ncbi:MAG: hypothetical protein ABJL55_01025 [Roseibium sp.]